MNIQSPPTKIELEWLEEARQKAAHRHRSQPEGDLALERPSQELSDPTGNGSLTLKVGSTTIRVWGDDHVETIINGVSVPASPDGSEGQSQTARELGYGNDVASMVVDHEIAHTLVCHWLFRAPSRVLEHVSRGEVYPLWWAEEEVALSLQKIARMTGVSLIEVARREE